MDSYKLFVRVGNAEFKAIGPEATVREQFDSFLNALSAIPTTQNLAAAVKPKKQMAGAAATVGGVVESGLPAGYHEQFDDDTDLDSDVDEAGQPLSKELIARAYRTDGDAVSLRVLPQGNDSAAEAILLLIYGFQTIRNENEVGALELTEAARRSGITLSRIDRTIARMTGLIRKGGRKRGTRYQLTNPGINRSEELLMEMFG